jgi:hypothetical protein
MDFLKGGMGPRRRLGHRGYIGRRMDIGEDEEGLVGDYENNDGSPLEDNVLEDSVLEDNVLQDNEE